MPLARTLKIVGLVFGILTVSAAVLVTLTLSVEAIRIPVVNYFLVQYEKLAAITDPFVAAPSDQNYEYVIDGPLAGVLPGEFRLERHETYRNGMVIAVYQNETGCSVNYSVRLSSAHINIDTQNADSRFLIINDKYGLYTQKENYQSFWWQDEEQNTVCLLESHNMDVADFMLLLEKYV